jgi:hypothetical protein
MYNWFVQMTQSTNIQDALLIVKYNTHSDQMCNGKYLKVKNVLFCLLLNIFSRNNAEQTNCTFN